MNDNLETRSWRTDDLDLLRASGHLFPPETYPRRFLAGGRRLQPLHLRVEAQLSAPDRRWAGQIALNGNEVVALAECAWDPAAPDSPTVAVNVAEAWRDSGVDRRVLRQLLSRCLSLGRPVRALALRGLPDQAGVRREGAAAQGLRPRPDAPARGP